MSASDLCERRHEPSGWGRLPMKSCKLIVAALAELLGAPAVLCAQSNLPPTLSLAVDDQARLECFRGRPLLARVELFNEQLMLNPGGTNTQVIGSPTNSWCNFITLQLTGSAGASIVIPLQLAN